MFDNDGFLIDFKQWHESTAMQIAAEENIDLSPEHWQVIHAARAYYQAFDMSPLMRPFIKWMAQTVDPQKARSAYLMMLFPGKTNKLISKIAGLPKPSNCL